jgi:hypothetical protein
LTINLETKLKITNLTPFETKIEGFMVYFKNTLKTSADFHLKRSFISMANPK